VKVTDIERRRWWLLGVGLVYTLLLIAEALYALPRMGVPHGGYRLAVTGPVLSNFVLSICCFLVAVPLGWRRPELRTARLAWGAAMLNAFFFLDEINYLLLVRGWEPPSWGLGLAFVHPWQLAAQFHCFDHFPAPMDRVSRLWRILRWVVLGVTVTMWLASLTAVAQLWRMPWAESAFAGIGVGAGSWNGIANAWGTPLLYLAVAAVGTRNYLALPTGMPRRRIQWVLAAVLVAAACMVLFQTVHAWRPIPSPYNSYLNLPGLLIPLAGAYALLTDELLGVSIVIRRAIQYLLARGTLEAAMVLPLLWLLWTAWREPERPVGEIFASSLLAAFGASLGLLLVRTPLLRWLDRRFFREAWDRDQILTRLLDGLAQGLPLEQTETMAKKSLEDAFHPTWMRIDYLDERQPRNQLDGALTMREGLVAIQMGPRKADVAYLWEDRHLIAAVARHLAVAFDRHRLLMEKAEAIAAERTRLARELHDGAAQGYAGISLHLESARLALGRDTDTAGRHIRAARDLAKTSLADTRRSMNELRRAGGDAAQPAFALAKRLRELEADVEVVGHIADLPWAVGHNLLRIAQEAVANARKHSGAGHVRVRCWAEEEGMVGIVIEDDGHGFDPNVGRPGALGLVGMRERASEIGAHLDMKSELGLGTRVAVRWSGRR
jgi:signal transduction histidine kinase